MVYPSNITQPDTITHKERSYIIFYAYEVDFNATKAKSYSDATETLAPRGAFILPMPNDGLMDSVTNNYDNGGDIMASAVWSKFEGAKQALSQYGGRVPDPKLTQAYQGTNSRKWSGTWQIVPQSAGESSDVSDILKFIKKAAAPDKREINNKIGMLVQPYVFKIEFSNPVIQKSMNFNQMAIEGYSINYFGQGYASTYKDNMPKQIQLTMNFAEFGIKTRKDW